MRDFSLETIQARKQWSNIFRALKENNYQPRICYPVKFFQKHRQNKDFSDIPKLKQFTTSTQHYSEGSSKCNKARTRNKEIQIGKEF